MPAASPRVPFRFGSRIAAASSVLMLLAACSTYELKVVRLAEPNPFSGTSTFVQEPVRFVDLQIDGRPEAEHVTASGTDKSAEWAQIKERIRDEFARRLAEELRGRGIELAPAAAGSTFHIRPTIDRIVAGKYMVQANIHMTVQVTGADATLDEFTIEDWCQYDLLIAPTVDSRMMSIVGGLADGIADHLEARLGR